MKRKKIKQLLAVTLTATMLAHRTVQVSIQSQQLQIIRTTRQV